MNNLHENRNIIEQYLLGELTAQDLTEVEDRIQSDPTFKQEVEEYRLLMEAIQEEDVMDFRQLIQDVETEIAGNNTTQTTATESTTKIRPLFGLPPIAIAAAVTLLLALTFIFMGGGGADPNQLYAEYYDPFPTYAPVRGDDDSTSVGTDSVWIQPYSFGKYEETLQQLKRFPQNNENRFYQAMCFMGLQQFDEAMAEFKNIIAQGEKADYHDESQWYLALSYLKTGKTDEAEAILKTIANAERPMFKKRDAKRILEQL